jgi:hypothetical protein
MFVFLQVVRVVLGKEIMPSFARMCSTKLLPLGWFVFLGFGPIC